MFGGLGVPELIIILVVVLIIFGPKNLPKLGSSIGKTVKNFRNEAETKGTDEAASTTDDAAAHPANQPTPPTKLEAAEKTAEATEGTKTTEQAAKENEAAQMASSDVKNNN